jgi:plastocyanin
MQFHRFLPKTGVALLSLTLTFGTVGTAGTASPEGPGGATVVLAHDFMFAPLSLTVKAGSTVTWTNRDEEPHTVTSDTGLFRSGAMDTDESFSYRFDKPGTYHYVCSIHPRMTGTIVVQ